jgi:hypothetical protein
MFSFIIPTANTASGGNPLDALSSIQENFLTRAFDFAAVNEWLWGVGAVVFLLTAIILFRAIRARRIRYNPFGTILGPQNIRAILRSAFEQRRPFEIQFYSENKHRRPTLRCAPEYIGRDSFTVELSGLKKLSDKWLGRPALVFFRIKSGKEFAYYSFESHLDGIHSPRPGVCHLTLPIPSSVENRQKRSFLRITPPKEFLLGAALWCEATMPPDEHLHEITSWPRPKLLFIPDNVEQFHLLDISAGGVRISVSTTVMARFDLHFTAAERLLLMMDLVDPEQNKRLRFWLQCRIQNAWIEHASNNLHMGVQFLAWARPREVTENSYEANAAAIEWLRLSSANEVEPLGNWIMRRHLELFRETPYE